MHWIASALFSVLAFVGSLFGHPLPAPVPKEIPSQQIASSTQIAKSPSASCFRASPILVDRNILERYAANNPTPLDNGWNIVSSTSPADAPFVNSSGYRELGACDSTSEVVVDDTLEPVTFCGTTYYTKRISVAGVDVVSRIGQLATMNNKIPSDPPKFSSPKNICDALRNEYAAGTQLSVHLFSFGTNESDEFWYPLYIGSLTFAIGTSTNLILQDAPPAYYNLHPEDDTPFGVEFTTGTLQ